MNNHSRKLDEAQLLQRRQRVAELYLQGKPQHEIAKEVGVVQATIQKDLNAMRAFWRLSAEADFAEKKAQELAKIDRLEQVAWDAWEKSREDGEVVRVREKAIRSAPIPRSGPKGGRPKKDPKNVDMRLIERTKETVQKGQDGDPRFLEQVGRCIEMRLRVMGLLKAGSQGGQGATVILNWGDMVLQPQPKAGIGEGDRGGPVALPQPHGGTQTIAGGNDAEEEDPIEGRILRARAGRDEGDRRPLGLPVPNTPQESGNAD